MYDELIKRCKALNDYNGLVSDEMIQEAFDCVKEAADAIEELSKCVDESIPKDDAEILIAEVAKPRWIPVTERLPEEGGNYLVVINCPRGRWDEICTFDVEKEWVSIDEYAEIATKWVTHWMPLPEPPKEET